MSRDALVAQFRAGSLERVGVLRAALAELAGGRGGPELVRTTLGELHTLKGEARMLGLVALSALAHGVEERLHAARAGDAGIEAEACDAADAALDTIASALRGELGGAASTDRALAAALAQLQGVPSGGTPSARARASPLEVAAPSSRPAAERWSRVSAASVDALCDLAYELRATFALLHAGLRAEDGRREQRAALLEDLDRHAGQLDALTSAAWALRLVPVEPALGQLAQHARDLAAAQGKRLRVALDARGAQLERGVLDELWDALVHLVRNAVDHGIERPGERGDKEAEGELTITAEPAGAEVRIAVDDDGRGIDLDRVRALAAERGLVAAPEALSDDDACELLFQPGFSTREHVTDISGRGLGLDVVRRKIDALGGAVGVTTAAGAGTRYTLTVPVTITKERILVVDLGAAAYGLPSRSVLVVQKPSPAEIEAVAGGRVLRFQGEPLPLRSLARSLGVEGDAPEPWALVVELSGKRWAFGVPSVVGEFHLVKRPVDGILARATAVAGSAVLDDGRLVLVLRVADLVARSERRATVPTGPARAGDEAARTPARILVVDDSPIIREILTEILAGAGFAVDTAPDGLAAIEAIDARVPDLVLSDVEMPSLDGFGLLERIRARWPRLRVIMVSTRVAAEDRRRAEALGAVAYLGKSDFQRSTLLETLRRFVQVSP